MIRYIACATLLVCACGAHEGDASLTSKTGANDGLVPQSTEAQSKSKTEQIVGETFEAFDQNDSGAMIEEKLAALRDREGAVDAIIAEYEASSAVESGDTLSGVLAGQQRWRAVYLLGQLGRTEAIPFLVDVALQSQPDFEAMSLDAAQTEMTIMQRSVAALGELNAVEELRGLYSSGGFVSRGAALELFTLGVPPKGIHEIDHEALMAEPAPIITAAEQSPDTHKP